MSELKPLKRHYLLLFPIAFLFLVLGILFELKIIWISFFILGFMWPWGLVTPDLKEKIKSPKYKFSFLKLMFWMQELVEDQVFFGSPLLIKGLSRLAGPLLFSFVLSILSGFEIFLICTLGAFLGELWLFMNKKFYPKAHEKSDVSLPENSL